MFLRLIHAGWNRLGGFLAKISPPAPEYFKGTGELFPRMILVANRWDYFSRFAGDGHEYKRFIPALLKFCGELFFIPIENTARIIPAILNAVPDPGGVPVLSVFQTAVPAGYGGLSSKGFRLLNWYTDDDMLFEKYSSKMAGDFELNITTYEPAVAGYLVLGARILLSQWAGTEGCEFRQTRRYLACFVGRMYGQRSVICSRLKEEFGDAVYLHDTRLKALSEAEMIEVYQNSWIAIDEPHSYEGKTLQIKARIFDNPSFGCVVATRPNPRLERYYKTGEEILFWDDLPGLIRLLRECRNSPEKCREMAYAAYRRTLSDHLYQNRFAEIFKSILEAK